MGQNCERALTPDDIIWVLNRTNICRLGVAEDNQPFVVPMFYTYCADPCQIIFRLLSRSNGLKMRCISRNQLVCIEVDVPVNGGFASVIGFGNAIIRCIGVDDCFNRRDEIEVCVSDITGRFYPSCT